MRTWGRTEDLLWLLMLLRLWPQCLRVQTGRHERNIVKVAPYQTGCGPLASIYVYERRAAFAMYVSAPPRAEDPRAARHRGIVVILYCVVARRGRARAPGMHASSRGGMRGGN